MILKKTFSIVLIFVMILTMHSIAFAEGEIPAGYTPIYTADDLNNIRNNLSGKYILMNDIDLSLYENWEPIGSPDEQFKGIFDGDGFAIKSLKINLKTDIGGIHYVGLFGYATKATIKNVTVADCRISLSFVGDETAKCRVGVISGFLNQSTIEDCVVAGNINSCGFSSYEIGGISGYIQTGSVLRCTNYTDIEINIDSVCQTVLAGGIFGVSKTIQDKCCNYGDITVSGKNFDDTAILKIGGINGDGSSNVNLKNSYNRGTLSIDFSTTKTYLGGLTGVSFIITNSYNAGNLILPEAFKGLSGAISGNVDTGVMYISEPPHIANSYYCNDDLPPAFSDGKLPEELEQGEYENVFKCVKALSDSEMKGQVNFENFDFENIWTMEENGYPVLQNQPKIEISKIIELEIGDSYKTEKKNRDWNSSDETVAVINELNEIIAVSAGTATIIIECDYGYIVKYIVTVTNKSEDNPIVNPDTGNQEPPTECWLIKILKQIFNFLFNIATSVLNFIF